MTEYAQAIHFNRPGSATQGHAPGMSRHIGTHHDAVQADAVPGALEQVAQEIAGNRRSAGLMDAINAGQSALGNRSFMQLAGAAQRQACAPDADSGNEPLQMMWPNLGRRSFAPLMSASVFRPGGASPTRPGSVSRLPLNPRRNVWDKDILFGMDHRNTLELAIKLEASTDSIIDRFRFRNLDKPVPPGFRYAHLWSKSGYGFADRNKLKRRDLPYMAYAREAIATALARGGNITWALGHLDFDKVFAELFRVETEHGTDPVRYMAEVSFPELMEKHGKYIDARTGEELTMPRINLNNPVDDDLEAVEKFEERVKNGEIKNIATFQPLITTTEIIGFLMGDERKYLDKTSFFDARHQETDRAEFVSAFSGVLDQLLARKREIGPDNEYKLEAQVYRPLDLYSGFPCGQCDTVFKYQRELEEHWKSFPGHRH